MNTILLLILLPIIFVLGIAVPIWSMERAVSIVAMLFPHLPKEKTKNVVEVAVVTAWVIGLVLISQLFFPDR